MSRKIDKNKKNDDIISVVDATDKAKSFVDQMFGNITKLSATKQIALGASSGWLTGFLAIRVAKTAALALGGGVILLEIANQKGYIKINWNKIQNNLDSVADTVEEKVTGQGPGLMDKVERFMDKQVGRAEKNISRQKRKVNSWYDRFMGNSNCQVKEMHIFLISFAAGVAIGIGTA